MEKLIAELEKTGNGLYYNGLDEKSVNRGKEILRNVKYIKGLPNDEDRAIFLRKNKDIKNEIDEINRVFGVSNPEIKKAYDSIVYPKTVKRDESGLKTIDEKALVQMANADSAEDLFDINSEKSWYKWTPAQVDAYAKNAGMTRGQFIKAVCELDTQNKRNAIAHEGVTGKVLAPLFFSRAQKAIEEGRSPTATEWAMDVAEDVAQAVPVGKAIGAAGKAGKAYKAANGTAATFGKAIAENAVVPTSVAFIDEARRDDSDFAKAARKSVIGTATNIFTPIRLGTTARNFGRFAGSEGSGAIRNAYANTTDKWYNNLVTNKLGKDAYAEQGVGIITSLDPTGVSQKAFDKIPGGNEYEAEKEAKHQRELEKKRENDINDEYTDRLIKDGVMERAMRRKYGNEKVDLWLKAPQYAPNQVLFDKIKTAKEEGYNEKL